MNPVYPPHNYLNYVAWLYNDLSFWMNELDIHPCVGSSVKNEHGFQHQFAINSDLIAGSDIDNDISTHSINSNFKILKTDKREEFVLQFSHKLGCI